MQVDLKFQPESIYFLKNMRFNFLQQLKKSAKFTLDGFHPIVRENCADDMIVFSLGDERRVLKLLRRLPNSQDERELRSKALEDLDTILGLTERKPFVLVTHRLLTPLMADRY